MNYSSNKRELSGRLRRYFAKAAPAIAIHADVSMAADARLFQQPKKAFGRPACCWTGLSLWLRSDRYDIEDAFYGKSLNRPEPIPLLTKP